MTDAVSAEVHAELTKQLDVFAKDPWGFLGLNGTEFRELIGYVEAICALVIITPQSPHNVARAMAFFVCFNILLAAFLTHVYHRDGRQLPALVLAACAMFLLTGEKRGGRKVRRD